MKILSEIHKKKKQKKKQKKILICIKPLQEETPNGIMDGFIRKVNQKVNLPGFAILKNGVLKTRPIKRF